jgi:NitT/TauT family transport system permease protein
MYVQVMNGTHHLDGKLLQMCRVYGITGRKYLSNFVIPSLVPSYVTGAKQSLSMIWKVVIAAEVLTVPQSGIGRSLQLAQVRLDTASVFAWTIIAVVLTFAGDFIFSVITKKKLSGRYCVEA